jgi:hypothetical protein
MVYWCLHSLDLLGYFDGGGGGDDDPIMVEVEEMQRGALLTRVVSTLIKCWIDVEVEFDECEFEKDPKLMGLRGRRRRPSEGGRRRGVQMRESRRREGRRRAMRDDDARYRCPGVDSAAGPCRCPTSHPPTRPCSRSPSSPDWEDSAMVARTTARRGGKPWNSSTRSERDCTLTSSRSAWRIATVVMTAGMMGRRGKEEEEGGKDR